MNVLNHLHLHTVNIKAWSLLLSAQTLHWRHPDLSVPLRGGPDRRRVPHAGRHLEHCLHGEATCSPHEIRSTESLSFLGLTGFFPFCSAGFWTGHRGLSVRPPGRSHILTGGRFVCCSSSVHWIKRASNPPSAVHSDHLGHIIELLGTLPSQLVLSGRNSKQYFNRKGKVS